MKTSALLIFSTLLIFMAFQLCYASFNIKPPERVMEQSTLNGYLAMEYSAIPSALEKFQDNTDKTSLLPYLQHISVDSEVSGRVAIGDIDNDGYNDVIVHTWGDCRGRPYIFALRA